jgi:hypothetical protein
MRYFKLLVLCGVMTLAASSLAPVMAEEEGCPDYPVSCSKKLCSCPGTPDGHGHCTYDAACQNGGCCSGLED